MNSGFLGPSKWAKFVDLKGRKYFASKKVKCMAADGLTLQHLFSIILYCDFGPLCTAFSATFRRQNVFENFQSVLTRHSKYAQFGHLLMGLVWRFGTNRRWEDAKGPFFCGINCELNIGSFAICLKGLCSTSTSQAVSLNFAKSNGIIVKLGNDSDSAEWQCFF